MFHPDGAVYRARVEAVPGPFSMLAQRLEGPALARLSTAWWRGGKEWLDALGIAVRLGRDPGTEARPGDQDLLFGPRPHGAWRAHAARSGRHASRLVEKVAAAPGAWMVAVVLQGILFGSAALALRSGEAEEDRVERVVAERLIEAHQQAAGAFVWASGGVLGAMVLALALSSRRGGTATALAATLGTVVVLGLGYRTGQAGGDLVYRHGAAQAYVGGGAQRGANVETEAGLKRGERGDDD
jgi:hypothetical protein